VICNDEDTDGRARVTTDEERVLLWSIVSKATDRSRRQRHDNFCDPMALMR